MMEAILLPDTAAARVLVVGDVMLDRFVIGRVSRISPEAPVPVVVFDHEEWRLGGAANVAHNLRAPLSAGLSLLELVKGGEMGEVSPLQVDHLQRIEDRPVLGEVVPLPPEQHLATGPLAGAP